MPSTDRSKQVIDQNDVGETHALEDAVKTSPMDL